MKKLLIFLIICFGNYAKAQDKTIFHIKENTVKEYQDILFQHFEYFTDSVKKTSFYQDAVPYFVVDVIIREFDTIQKKLKVIFEYHWVYAPFQIRATHWTYFKNTYFSIRFGENVPKEIIKKSPFKFITEEEVITIKNEVKKFEIKYGSPSGFTESFVAEYSNGNQRFTWYEKSDFAPLEDSERDTTYFSIKYKNYLELKYKEFYGAD